ncbi:olfactory receptor 14A16-like [Apteryx mantelli]|uniref:Olfactory receptor 14A16-like n=1 Tax=Apteryx mantelli TaxID=2696672 RepID=A0ABM4FMH2_9AVES
MAYDRFVAICRPLHYGTLMSSRACVKMAAAAWASGFLNALLHTGNTFSIPLCQGNVVEQFFCEVPQLLKLSCSDAYLREVAVIVFNLCLTSGCFVFIVLTYVQIFTAVLRMPSEQGRHKAFSMCLPHLAVVSLSLSTVMIACLKPPSISSPVLDLGVAVLYTVVPPAESLEEPSRSWMVRRGLSFLQLQKAPLLGKRHSPSESRSEEYVSKRKSFSLATSGRLTAKPEEKPDITRLELFKDVSTQEDLLEWLIANVLKKELEQGAGRRVSERGCTLRNWT